MDLDLDLKLDLNLEIGMELEMEASALGLGLSLWSECNQNKMVNQTHLCTPVLVFRRFYSGEKCRSDLNVRRNMQRRNPVDADDLSWTLVSRHKMQGLSVRIVRAQRTLR